MYKINKQKIGYLAKTELGLKLPLVIMQSNAGWYIGTYNDEGPVSRESEYFPSKKMATDALNDNDWMQRLSS